MSRWQALLLIVAVLVFVGVLSAASLMYSSDVSPIGYFCVLAAAIGIAADAPKTPDTVSPEDQP